MWEFSQDSVTEQLKVDQALLNVSSTLDDNLWLYQLSSECVACPYKKLKRIPARSYIVERINTATQLKWSLYKSNIGPYAFENTTAHCVISPDNLGQFGIYNLTIDDKGCSFNTHQTPVNRDLSIILVLVFIALVYVAFTLLQSGRQYWLKRQNTTASTSQLDGDATVAAVNASIQKNTSQRLRSLDAFRGLAIVTMIFANSGCGKYHWLEHASWNGIHPADFIFPSFLWIMGVCIPISLKSQFAKNIPRSDILSNIFVRSVKLFFIGLLIHTAHGPDIRDIRIMGVLQRFGISYLVVASLQVLLRKQVAIDSEERSRSWRISFLDVTSLSSQWIIMLVITAFHLIVIFFIPVPNCGVGYLGPGGIHEMGRFNNCIGGATGYVDRLIIGTRHLYQRPRATAIYDERMPFDPEGPFGCLLTIVQVFFGVQCGNTLLLFTRPIDRLKRFLSWSIITFLLGGCLCQFSINDGLIPINKNLWSLSFVLVTTSVAFLILSIFYVIIDVKCYWSGKPLTFAGMNAILMYIGSELFGRMYPFYWHFNGMNTHFMFLLSNLWTAAAWTFVAYYLYIRNFFFSL
ncbi:heparan-alpha-glucosaminide N-acetyltransferase [Contarinia nasturtii]|uniref:heparan-alpha-glucosaminide N-acetyltransferase n=1 Tax=Contarinia nasturtii TaxID=265458 RepID=UPI0012D386BC|nr:heparan-alpha-glucosaminide N-acetyltransferase [Contarinia nasturtii]XP_031628031.1 heparan-alpha-glucosaminide N-acetyltransferase [Contarinia nasturtii]XP_031628032.1 heparan-alpha-glucosaminide N-acetyltransferase [Contarinia nasturtii]